MSHIEGLEPELQLNPVGRQGQRWRSGAVGVNLLPAADKASHHSPALLNPVHRTTLSVCLVCVYHIGLVLSMPHGAVLCMFKLVYYLSVYTGLPEIYLELK